MTEKLSRNQEFIDFCKRNKWIFLFVVPIFLFVIAVFVEGYRSLVKEKKLAIESVAQTQENVAIETQDAGIQTQENVAIETQDAGIQTQENVAIETQDAGIQTQENVAIETQDAGIQTQENVAIKTRNQDTQVNDIRLLALQAQGKFDKAKLKKIVELMLDIYKEHEKIYFINAVQTYNFISNGEYVVDSARSIEPTKAIPDIKKSREKYITPLMKCFDVWNSEDEFFSEEKITVQVGQKNSEEAVNRVQERLIVSIDALGENIPLSKAKEFLHIVYDIVGIPHGQMFSSEFAFAEMHNIHWYKTFPQRLLDRDERKYSRELCKLCAELENELMAMQDVRKDETILSM